MNVWWSHHIPIQLLYLYLEKNTDKKFSWSFMKKTNTVFGILYAATNLESTLFLSQG